MRHAGRDRPDPAAGAGARPRHRLADGRRRGRLLRDLAADGRGGSARLSLARTAAALTALPGPDPASEPAAPAAPSPISTPWGPGCRGAAALRAARRRVPLRPRPRSARQRRALHGPERARRGRRGDRRRGHRQGPVRRLDGLRAVVLVEGRSDRAALARRRARARPRPRSGAPSGSPPGDGRDHQPRPLRPRGGVRRLRRTHRRPLRRRRGSGGCATRSAGSGNHRSRPSCDRRSRGRAASRPRRRAARSRCSPARARQPRSACSSGQPAQSALDPCATSCTGSSGVASGRRSAWPGSLTGGARRRPCSAGAVPRRARRGSRS